MGDKMYPVWFNTLSGICLALVPISFVPMIAGYSALGLTMMGLGFAGITFLGHIAEKVRNRRKQ